MKDRYAIGYPLYLFSAHELWKFVLIKEWVISVE